MSEHRISISPRQSAGISALNAAARAALDKSNAFLDGVLLGLDIPEGAEFTGNIDTDTHELIFTIPEADDADR